MDKQQVALKTPRVKSSLLFNKFRTFMTYGALAFEFYELLTENEPSLEDINGLVPGSRSELFTII